MAVTVKIEEDQIEEIKKVVDECGFHSTEEFISSAIEQKLIELQREKFYHLTDRIREGIGKKGYTVKQAVEEIEKMRHEDHHSG